MNEILTKEEIKNLAHVLGYEMDVYFEAYLADFNDLYELNSDELTNEELAFKLKDSFITALNKVKEEMQLKEDLSNLSTHELILLVIEITKKLCVNYLLNKHEGVIDRLTAEKMVTYGYTHGSCNSLLFTLATLFKECQPKIIRTKGQCHQFVMIGENCYDIMGCSTLEEMKNFVLSESKDKKEYSVEDVELQAFRHKAIDFMLTQYISEVFYLGNRKEDNIIL